MDHYDGYMGQVLFVDLTKRTHSLFPWTDKDRKRTLGGKGEVAIAGRISLDERFAWEKLCTDFVFDRIHELFDERGADGLCDKRVSA